jgi:ATP-binding cassette, subfamily C (CFTR/MRP), member 1
MECIPGADDVFGPRIHGCRDFDFTLLFEQILLQAAPSVVLLLSIPPRIWFLRKQALKSTRSNLTWLKLAAVGLLSATQIIMLSLWASAPRQRTSASIPAATVSTLGALALVLLSGLEDSHSVRPSAIINTYMLFSLLLDIPQARTLWLRPGPTRLPIVFSVGIAFKLIGLYLEACTRRRFLLPPYRVNAPEMLVSIYDRTLLWWLNPTFFLGFKSRIAFEDLSPIDDGLSSEYLDHHFQHIWSQYQDTSGSALLLALAIQCRFSVIAFMVPRLFLSAFKVSQPLLINRITTTMARGVTQESTNAGRGLIGATALVYCGLALSNVIYKRQLQRFQTKLRGVLVTSLYRKMLVLSAEVLADNTAVTL